MPTQISPQVSTAGQHYLQSAPGIKQEESISASLFSRFSQGLRSARQAMVGGVKLLTGTAINARATFRQKQQFLGAFFRVSSRSYARPSAAGSGPTKQTDAANGSGSSRFYTEGEAQHLGAVLDAGKCLRSFGNQLTNGSPPSAISAYRALFDEYGAIASKVDTISAEVVADFKAKIAASVEHTALLRDLNGEFDAMGGARFLGLLEAFDADWNGLRDAMAAVNAPNGLTLERLNDVRKVMGDMVKVSGAISAAEEVAADETFDPFDMSSATRQGRGSDTAENTFDDVFRPSVQRSAGSDPFDVCVLEAKLRIVEGWDRNADRKGAIAQMKDTLASLSHLEDGGASEKVREVDENLKRLLPSMSPSIASGA